MQNGKKLIYRLSSFKPIINHSRSVSIAKSGRFVAQKLNQYTIQQTVSKTT